MFEILRLEMDVFDFIIYWLINLKTKTMNRVLQKLYLLIQVKVFGRKFIQFFSVLSPYLFSESKDVHSVLAYFVIHVVNFFENGIPIFT